MSIVGFEPTLDCLKDKCSTLKLYTHALNWKDSNFHKPNSNLGDLPISQQFSYTNQRT